MKAVVWIVGVLVVSAIELVMVGAVWAMAHAENCGNGISRWECNDALKVFLFAAILVVPSGALLLADRVARHRT